MATVIGDRFEHSESRDELQNRWHVLIYLIIRNEEVSGSIPLRSTNHNSP